MRAQSVGTGRDGCVDANAARPFIEACRACPNPTRPDRPLQVEEAVTAEPDLDDLQREWLRASAYDSYDLLVMSDELVHMDRADPAYLKLCLDIIAATTPGTDSHVQAGGSERL